MSQEVEMKASLMVEDMLMDRPTTEVPYIDTVEMCFVAPNMVAKKRFNKAHNSMMQDRIQIVQCEPDDVCFPSEDSDYISMGLGYVFI